MRKWIPRLAILLFVLGYVLSLTVRHPAWALDGNGGGSSGGTAAPTATPAAPTVPNVADAKAATVAAPTMGASDMLMSAQIVAAASAPVNCGGIDPGSSTGPYSASDIFAETLQVISADTNVWMNTCLYPPSLQATGKTITGAASAVAVTAFDITCGSSGGVPIPDQMVSTQLADGTSVTCPSVTTNFANELEITEAQHVNGVSTAALVAAAGQTQLFSVASQSIVAASVTVAAAGASPTVSFNGDTSTTKHWSCVSATFRCSK